MSVNTNVTVTFSEAMGATTVTTSTIQLLDPTPATVTANVTYDPATFTATLDPASPLARGVVYTVMVKGGNTGVKDVAGNALAADATSSFTTIPLPPMVVSLAPAPNTPDVPVNIAPTAKFARALDPDSVNTNTVLLSNTTDPANLVPVAVTVSYDPDTFTVAFVPTSPLQPGQTYLAKLRGGSTGQVITDTIQQPLAADVSFTFTTAAAQGLTTFTVFTTPAQIPMGIFNDNAPREFGMKFRANQDGVVTGVQFYKGDASNGGIHIGHLWTINGAPLGSATFSNETDSGWQQANFSTPIAITAGTNYVVSYFNPLGIYNAANFFFNDPLDNPPLLALGNGDLDSPGNGVFLDTGVDPQQGGFPNQSFNATNYGVDVVFATAPQVFSVTPAPGAANVPTNFQPTATFSEALTPGSVTTDTVLLRTAGNIEVPISSISYNPSTFTITITPQQDLQPGRAYTVILKGGSAGPRITDMTGTALPADYIWSFTTAPGTP